MEQKPSFFGHRKRLRQKFFKSGFDSFLPHEILELLLTYAIPRKDTKKLAWSLLKKFGSLTDVLDAAEEDLQKIEGLGPSSVLLIKLIRDIIRAYAIEQVKRKAEINTPENLVDFCKASMHGSKEEAFDIIYLSIRNTVIAVERLCHGTLDKAVINPRKILEKAFEHKAAGLIFVHNHPSGDPKPSSEDTYLTETIINLAAPFNISILDHIIVGRGQFYSIKSENLIFGSGDK